MMCMSRKRIRLCGLRLESLANLTLEKVLSADVLLVCKGHTRVSTVIIERTSCEECSGRRDDKSQSKRITNDAERCLGFV